MPHRTHLTPPVHLGYPLPDPPPAQGCAACEALAAYRAEARGAGDLAAVSDCNVGIRRHPHEDHLGDRPHPHEDHLGDRPHPHGER
ncbi:hypothetical protein SRB5_14490 [Streptomyces sp. RB5]|uniref:Uncharacterized protein n=1 Tax=Streptomyces smaragdinus TaxID=2585196 RepID=A0A7K0CEZ4_9ACTN|nr:hypothetical protein [Streptomyces smaragdinus]MQY11334.1 hypothetical protein [Streptomyces smaragdinus]